MPCDTWRSSQKQTVQERVDEMRKVVQKFSEGLATGRIKPKVGPQGAIAFEGISNEDRRGVTDACAYRRIMATGSALAKAAIAKAEQLAGRSVDRKVIAQGVHSHDGGAHWHGGHK
jgi:hypothetical protein